MTTKIETPDLLNPNPIAIGLGAAPGAEALNIEKSSGTNIKILDSDIDNPSGGNCAFYAFAIGLINIIQEEHLAGKTNQFDKWVKLDPGIASLFEALCNHDLTKEEKPTDQKIIAFLMVLQRSLRTINYNYQLQRLKEECSKSLVPSAVDFADQDKAYTIKDATLASLDEALVSIGTAPVNPAKPAVVFHDKDPLDKQAFNLAILIFDLAQQIAAKSSPKDLEKLIEYNTQLKGLKEQCLKYSLADSSKFVDLSKALDKLKLPKKRSTAARAASQVALIAEAEALAKQAVGLAKQVIATTKANKARVHAYRWVSGSSLFIDFLSVYYYRNRIDANGKETTALSGSPQLEAAVDKINKGTVQIEYESLAFVPLFLSLLYGENWSSAPITKETEPKADSPIITSLARAKCDVYWGTYVDLNFLGNALDVDVLYLINGKSNFERKTKEAVRHLITVNNHNNYHWTTVIKYAQDLTTDGKAVAKKPAIPASPAKKEDGKLSSSSSSKAGNAAGKLSAGSIPKQGSPPAGVLSSGITPKSEGTVAGAGDKLSAGNSTVKPKERSDPKSEPLPFLKKEPSPAVEAGAAKMNPPSTKLDLLKYSVNRAVLDYLNYSDSLWFSLFHRHGHAGRTRAYKFLGDFNGCDTCEKAQEKLVSFLKDNNDNGNTYSHSFKTMLLNEIMFSSEKEKPRKDLADTSKNFEQILARLIKKWSVDPIPAEPENTSWWSWK